MLESLDDHQLATYRADLAARLEPVRVDDGHFELEQRAAAVIADVSS